MNKATAVLVGVLAVILTVAFAVTAWQLGWFVEAKNVDRRTQVTNLSVGRQQAIQSQVLREITTVRDIDTQEQTPAVIAQRKAIVTSICENAGMLSGSLTLPPSAQSFINKECPA